MDPTLRVLGAADTVTGSRYLIEAGDTRVLVECGLFQGYKVLRERNRLPFPVPPPSIDAVILTHAHLDHSGYLPALVRDGYHGPVHVTAGTADLLAILLPDSGRLLEEEAESHRRAGSSRHADPRPLYTESDALHALDVLRPADNPFSPDGRLLAYAGNDRDPTCQDVLVCDLATGESRRVLAAEGLYTPVAFSPDSAALCVVSEKSNTDNDAYLVDLVNGGEPQLLTPHDGEVKCLPGPWLPDGSGVVVVSDAGLPGTVVHVAGALAKPVWMLLAHAPGHMWLLDRTDTPWYPTFQLFRQPAFKDWATPVAEVTRLLRERLRG